MKQLIAEYSQINNQYPQNAHYQILVYNPLFYIADLVII